MLPVLPEPRPESSEITLTPRHAVPRPKSLPLLPLRVYHNTLVNVELLNAKLIWVWSPIPQAFCPTILRVLSWGNE